MEQKKDKIPAFDQMSTEALWQYINDEALRRLKEAK